jgi:hypothetical protein
MRLSYCNGEFWRGRAHEPITFMAGEDRDNCPLCFALERLQDKDYELLEMRADLVLGRVLPLGRVPKLLTQGEE